MSSSQSQDQNVGDDTKRAYNILMILTDQEQSLPKALLDKLPAHRKLLDRGLLVENYHVQTTPCSPSRSTIFCGHHTQKTGLYLNSILRRTRLCPKPCRRLDT